jgi:hypothetical protein
MLSMAAALYACPVSHCRNMLWLMAEFVPEPMAIPPVAASNRLSRLKLAVVKIIILTILAVALGLVQGWTSSGTYKPDHVAGFGVGVLHGMLMPAALPALLLGQDLPIYAPNNSGRPYNIGYIFGINTCGFLFFGVGFWRPHRRRS